jgi:hypothetical protein
VRLTHQRDKTARDFELREAARIGALINDLNRVGRLLGADISAGTTESISYNL